MQSIEILDIKNFMQLLLQTDTLNYYHFVSGTLQTDMLYTFDGHINKDFFNEEEISSLSLENTTYLSWSLAKEKIFLLIRGKKTPSLLKIVLRATPEQTKELLSASNSSLKLNDIDGIFINIVFQNQKLHVTCGVSYKIFTLDKELEEDFTNKIIALFKSNHITCTK